MTNDELWKGIIEDLDIEFLHKFFADSIHLFDLTKPIIFLDKELSQIMPESEDSGRSIDKLLQVSLKTGDNQLILIHPEVQGYRHENYAEREFIYFYRLYDRFKIPIVTLVIFTDSELNYEPSYYSYSFLGTEILYKYRTYKVMKQSAEALAASDNPFDAVILTAYWAIERKREKLSEEDLADLKIDLMRRLLVSNYDKKRIRKLLVFIKTYLRFEKPEIILSFEENYLELLKIDKPMGVVEILIKQAKEETAAVQIQAKQAKEEAAAVQIQAKQAKEEATAQTKIAVSNLRKEGFSTEKIAYLLAMDVDKVKTLLNELDAESK